MKVKNVESRTVQQITGTVKTKMPLEAVEVNIMSIKQLLMVLKLLLEVLPHQGL